MNCSGSKLFWPVVMILLGVLILMINLGYLPAGVSRYWPILPIIWGLLKLSEVDESRKKK